MLRCCCHSSDGQARGILEIATIVAPLIRVNHLPWISLRLCFNTLYTVTALLLGPLLLIPLLSLHPAHQTDSLSVHPHLRSLPLQPATPTMKYDEILKWRQDVYQATIGQYAQPAVAATSSRRVNSTWAVSHLSAHMEQGASLSAPHSSIQSNSPLSFADPQLLQSYPGNHHSSLRLLSASQVN